MSKYADDLENWKSGYGVSSYLYAVKKSSLMAPLDEILTKKVLIDVLSIFCKRKDLKFLWFFSIFFDQVPKFIFRVTTYLNFSYECVLCKNLVNRN